MLMLVLPKAHRDTLEVLFVFLKWVASFAHLDERTGSKMDLPNLATVICPSILYSQGRDAVRDDSFGAIRVVQALLENQDEFYTVPEEFAGLLGDQAASGKDDARKRAIIGVCAAIGGAVALALAQVRVDDLAVLHQGDDVHAGRLGVRGQNILHLVRETAAEVVHPRDVREIERED